MEIPLARVGQRGPHQGVPDTVPLARRRDLGVLELEDVVAERRIHQLRIAVGQRHEEAGAFGIVLDRHQASGAAFFVR